MKKKQHIITYSGFKLGILTKILSIHNSLNHHMTREKLRYDECYEYCTEVMEHCDPNWKINCIETAQHILCRCPYFKGITDKIINFFEKFSEENHELAKGTYLQIE